MDSIDMINALISLSRSGAEGLDAFNQLGYRDIRLEYPTGISGGKGVVVDLLLISTAINSFLCIESKSGRNIEVAQGRGYLKVKAAQFASLVSKWHTVSAFTVDVAYVCTAANLASIRKGLAGANLEHAVLCFRQSSDDDWQATLDKYPHLRPALANLTQPCLITLERGKLKNPRLAARLSRSLVFDLANIEQFIGFDLSAKPERITHALLRVMREYAAQGKTSFSSEEITIAAYGAAAWQKTQRRADIIHRVADTLTAMSEATDLRLYFGPEPAPTRQAAKLRWWLDLPAEARADFEQSSRH